MAYPQGCFVQRRDHDKKGFMSLKPKEDCPGPLAGSTRCSDVAAFGTVRATAEMLPSLRQRPGPPGREPLPPSFLKHADEQTVASLAAVFQAIHSHNLATTCFTDWGVLAAPRFLGRVTMAAALKKFAVEGAWGISPHMIPHRSLHSISGTVSQALRIHGPNFGVGGGPGAAAEVLLAATAMLVGECVPGVWVVMSGWDPEPVPERNGQAAASVCAAVALALVAPRPEWAGPRLRIAPCGTAERPPRGPSTHDPFSLEGLLVALAEADLPPTTVVWSLDGGGRIELEMPGAAGMRPRNGATNDGGLRGQAQRIGAGAENQL
jgi:hypothetical protein